MTYEQETRLIGIKNYHTRYEIVAERDSDRLLIGYTPRKSRHGLLAAMQHVGQAIIERLNVGENDEITWQTKPYIHAITSGWRIGFSGRTERDAILSGELPFVAKG